MTLRLVYLSNAAIPSRASNAMQTMRMCRAFVEAGCDVELLHAADPAEIPEGAGEDVWAFYGVAPVFARRRLPLPTAPLAARSRRYSLLARAAMLGAAVGTRARPGAPVFACYARSLLGARLAVDARRIWRGASSCRAVALELHDEPPGRRGWDVAARADALFPITEALRQTVVERLPQVADRTWVEPDGVDLEPYLAGDRASARRRLGLPADERLVVYTGRAIAGKGVNVLLDAAERLAGIARVHVVGKVYEPEYERRAAALPNVTLTGFVPPSAAPTYQLAADVLVLPTAEDLAYVRYTSPLKLFEYMATGNPVVASDLPAVREVLRHEHNALLYPPADARALAAAVARLLAEPRTAQEIAVRARQEVEYYRWSARAARIVTRLTQLMSDAPTHDQTPE